MSQSSLKRSRRDGTDCIAASNLISILTQERTFSVDPGAFPSGSLLDNMVSSEWRTVSEIDFSHRDSYMIELVVGHLRGLALAPDLSKHAAENLRRETLYLGLEALEAEAKAILGPPVVELVKRQRCPGPITSAHAGLKHLKCIRLRDLNVKCGAISCANADDAVSNGSPPTCSPPTPVSSSSSRMSTSPS